MRRFIHFLKSGYLEVGGLSGCFFWRGLERCLSIESLYAFARAVCVGRALFNELWKRPAPPCQKPEWRNVDGSIRSRIRRRSRRYLDFLLENFPDRLTEPQWRSRCRLEGVAYLETARLAGRPVVLACFHFGQFYMLRKWLRGFGFPVAAFMGKPTQRQYRRNFLNQLSPFREVPLAFYPDQLRAVSEFLAAGNTLVMAVDSPVGKQMAVPFGQGWTFDMTAGAARLAARQRADLILVSIINEGGWRYRMKFSAPVPGEQLQQEADRSRAYRRLLDEMMLDMKAYPEQFDLPKGWNPVRATAP